MIKRSTPRAARRALFFGAALLLSSTPVGAQSGRPARTQPPPLPTQPQQPARGARSSELRVELQTPVAETPVPFVPDAPRRGPVETLSFTSPEAVFDRRVVKDSPFSAESVTEHVQTLADGNRFVRKSSARLYRDSHGRTRREHTLTRGGAAGATTLDGEPPRLVVINDPVAGVNYQFETRGQTARRMVVPPGMQETRERAFGGGGGDRRPGFGVLMPAASARRRAAEGDNAPPMPAPKTEQLGTQTVEGVAAEGTRVTVTIPAGEFDNERDMEIAHEEWYSPELKMVVLMRHLDPRFGETTFRLTNLSRGEQDASLFASPAGYKIVSAQEDFSDFPRGGRGPGAAPVRPPRGSTPPLVRP